MVRRPPGCICPSAPETCRPTYVYRAYNHRGRLLYVGASANPEHRFLSRAGHRIFSHWFADVADVTIARYECYTIARNAETEAIKEEWPLWNRIGSPDWEFLRRYPQVAKKIPPLHCENLESIILRAVKDADRPARLAREAREAREEVSRLRRSLDEYRTSIRAGKITDISIADIEAGHLPLIALAEQKATEAAAAALEAQEAWGGVAS